MSAASSNSLEKGFLIDEIPIYSEESGPKVVKVTPWTITNRRIYLIRKSRTAQGFPKQIIYSLFNVGELRISYILLPLISTKP